jgi:hypothetical protein
MTVVDVSVTLPPGVGNTAAAAATGGAAVALRDTARRQTYNKLKPKGYPFVSFSVETYSRLGKPAISLLGHFDVEAEAEGPRVS